jgi:uncharacterized protein (TIGR02118 family)
MEFHRYWLEQHGPRVSVLPSLRRYTQSPARPGGYTAGRAPPFDGISSLWFDSTDDMLHALRSAEYAAAAADALNFTAPDAGQRLICTEHIIIE